MLAFCSGAGNAVTLSKGVLIPIPTRSTQNGAATTGDAVTQVTQTGVADFTQTSTVAGDIRTRITEALTTIIQTAAGKAGPSDAVTTELRSQQ